MGTPTLSLPVIAERIADSILSEKYVNKGTIIDKITVNLKVWHKLTNRPVDYDKIKTDKGRLQYTIEKKDIELEFWRKKMKETTEAEKMNEYYLELKNLTTELGY